jgi:hypothetical protein
MTTPEQAARAAAEAIMTMRRHGEPDVPVLYVGVVEVLIREHFGPLLAERDQRIEELEAEGRKLATAIHDAGLELCLVTACTEGGECGFIVGNPQLYEANERIAELERSCEAWKMTNEQHCRELAELKRKAGEA